MEAIIGNIIGWAIGLTIAIFITKKIERQNKKEVKITTEIDMQKIAKELENEIYKNQAIYGNRF